MENKLIEQQGDIYVIDAEKLGFNKVLGYGKLTKKYKISSPYFSKGAAEKIKAAGGELIGLKEKKIKKKTQPEKEETSSEAAEETPKAEGAEAKAPVESEKEEENEK